MSLKGSLPINTMVLLAIAFIVLLAIIMIIYSGIQPPTRAVMLQNSVQQCCWSYLSGGCEDKTITCKAAKELGYPDDTTIDTLAIEAGIADLDKYCKCP